MERGRVKIWRHLYAHARAEDEPRNARGPKDFFDVRLDGSRHTCIRFGAEILELLGKDASVIYRIGLEPGVEWGYIAPEKENWVTFLVDNPPDFIAVQFRYLPGKAEDLSS